MTRNPERTLGERVAEVDERCLQGKIYMYDLNGEVYVGSTIGKLEYRHMKHRYHTTTPNSSKHNYPLYQHIRSMGICFDEVEITLLENHPCKNKWFLRQRERKWCEILNATLNTRLPNRTDKEWRDDNSEVLKLKASLKNKQINHKQRYAIRREEQLEYKRQHYAEHREFYSIRQKEKYERNKEQMCSKQEAYGKQPAKCPLCLKEMRRDSVRKHIKAIHPFQFSTHNINDEGNRRKTEEKND
jgi:hypothetical protein